MESQFERSPFEKAENIVFNDAFHLVLSNLHTFYMMAIPDFRPYIGIVLFKITHNNNFLYRFMKSIRLYQINVMIERLY